jgi:hypothetical protein
MNLKVAERRWKWMKNGKKLSAAERKHVESSKLKSSDWLLAKKESDKWLLVHRNVASQTKVIFAPTK